MQSADSALDLRGRPDAVDLGEERRERREPVGLDLRLVQAGGVGVAGELLGAAGGPVSLRRGLLEERLETLAIGVAREGAAAPARLPLRDRMGGQPAAVGEGVEIGARVDATVEIAGGDADA